MQGKIVLNSSNNNNYDNNNTKLRRLHPSFVKMQGKIILNSSTNNNYDNNNTKLRRLHFNKHNQLAFAAVHRPTGRLRCLIWRLCLKTAASSRPFAHAGPRPSMASQPTGGRSKHRSNHGSHARGQNNASTGVKPLAKVYYRHTDILYYDTNSRNTSYCIQASSRCKER